MTTRTSTMCHLGAVTDFGSHIVESSSSVDRDVETLAVVKLGPDTSLLSRDPDVLEALAQMIADTAKTLRAAQPKAA